jgi:hypothetical protein
MKEPMDDHHVVKSKFSWSYWFERIFTFAERIFRARR